MTLPETAPALVVPQHGGREVLTVEDRPVSPPGPDEALVKVAACGVNFIDVYQREGVYDIATPFVPGLEGAGEVVAVGPEVTEIIVGDRVAWAMNPGSAQTYAAVPAAKLVPVPPDVPLEVAAAVLLQGMTAHFLTHSTFAAGRGHVALVHAAAGGVGQLLVQMLKRKGATVIAVAGSPEKIATARALGADEGLDSSATDDLAAAVRDATGGAGADVVYDGVGKDTFDASLASLKPRGLLVVFGAASGPVPPLDIQRLNAAGSVFLTRPSLAHYIAGRAELRARAGAVFAGVASGELRVDVGKRYPMAESASAYEALEGRRTQGKLILVP